MSEQPTGGGYGDVDGNQQSQVDGFGAGLPGGTASHGFYATPQHAPQPNVSAYYAQPQYPGQGPTAMNPTGYALSYEQAGYYAPMRVAMPVRNGMGTAALVLGIVGLFFSWAPYLGWSLPVMAIIFGGVGKSNANKGIANNGGSAVAGIVLGTITIALWVLLFSALFSFL